MRGFFYRMSVSMNVSIMSRIGVPKKNKKKSIITLFAFLSCSLSWWYVIRSGLLILQSGRTRSRQDSDTELSLRRVRVESLGRIRPSCRILRLDNMDN
jgi:hypothetical protein